MKYIIFILSLLLPYSMTAQTAEEAKRIHEQGMALLNEGKYLEGRKVTEKAMEMRKKLFGEVNEDYITSLNNYALSFLMTDDYPESVRLLEKAMELCDKLETPHKNIGMYTVNMGRCYYLNGNEDAAVKAWEKALPLVEKHGEMYEFILNNLGMIYIDRQDTENMSRVMALAEEHNRYELTKECNEPGCMLERGQYFAAVGDNAAAKEWFLKAFSMPMNDNMKKDAYVQYADYLSNVKDFASSAEYYVFAANLHKDMVGIDETYANYTYMAAIRFYLGTEYEKSISYFQKCLDYYKSIDHPTARANEALCWTDMGNTYNAIKKYDKAVEYHSKAVSYYAKNESDGGEYPKSLQRLASAEKFNKEYESAISHYKVAMEIFELKGMWEEYSNTANSLKLCLAYAGRTEDVKVNVDAVKAEQNEKLDKIIKEELEHLELTRTYLGQLAYAQSLGVIAGSYQMKGEYTEAVEYYKLYIESLREAIKDEFRMQTPAERMLTWNEQFDGLQTLRELLVELPIGNEKLMPNLISAIYDAELLSKGILLNSSIEFEKVLLAQGDNDLVKIYETTKLNDNEIEHLRNNASTDADLAKLLDLMQRNQNLQMQLYKGCAEFADFTDYMSFTWEDVRKSMADKDIAIEFLAIERDVFDSDNFMAALVLTKEMSSPVAIPICNIEEAKAMVDYPELFNMDGNFLWGLFDEYLKGKERIFFAADHSFNRVGLEYIQYNGKPLSEQFKVYRLSSTKEICKVKSDIALERVALFGDINYNDYALYSEQVQRSIDALRANDNGFANLDYTMKEVIGISESLKEKTENLEMFTGNLASKEAFLRLSDSKVNMIHIATHGIYSSSDKANDAESMANSLLVFAGANLTVGSDESLVSAADVSAMNLRYCDLAVLSACETGLGGLGSDGVFGLQRGFKNAGVRTLLMSLKKVYDSSTAELMINFYSNLMKGQSKREALVNAQRHLREIGYENSKYWATFILLDALE